MERVNNYFHFFLSIHLPTHNPLLRLPSLHLLCFPLMSRILMLMELISCCAVLFFSICTSYRRGLLGRGGCEDGGERRESRADFDGGGKLEKELYEGDKLMCAARPPGLQDLLGILRRWLKSQLSLKRRPTLPFNLKGVSNTVTGLQNRSQTETPRRLLGTQLLRPPVLMTNAAINFFFLKRRIWYKNKSSDPFGLPAMLQLKAFGCSLLFLLILPLPNAAKVSHVHSSRSSEA